MPNTVHTTRWAEGLLGCLGSQPLAVCARPRKSRGLIRIKGSGVLTLLMLPRWWLSRCPQPWLHLESRTLLLLCTLLHAGSLTLAPCALACVLAQLLGPA